MGHKIKLNLRIDKVWLLAIAVGVVAVDQLTKFWAFNTLKDGPNHIIWILDFRLLFNRGAILGIGGNNSGYFFIIISGVLLLIFLSLVFLKYTHPLQEVRYLVAFAFLTGGAIGNTGDRIFREGRAVVDFIDVWKWPVFNVADSAITLGAIFLASMLLLSNKSPKQNHGT